jgi:ABC-2 type transport system ATP-binding protein
MSEASIVAAGLGRAFDGRWAVRDLDLAVAPGEIYGFLGQNGAGKTTTLRMFAGLLRPSAGELRIAGLGHASAGRALRRRIGFLPDTPPLHDYLTGRQHLALVASLWGVPRRERDARGERLFDALGITGAADELCKAASHGTRKKIHLAAVLATAPSVLLLDEPTSGLDPLAVRQLKDLLLEQARGGATVFLSTHGLELAEQVCHRIGILAGGQLRAEGAAAALRAQHGDVSLEDVFLAVTRDAR